MPLFIEDGKLKYIGSSGSSCTLASDSGIMHLLPMVNTYGISSGTESLSTNTFTAIGTISFDPSSLFAGDDEIVRLITFEAIVESTSGVTAEIRLYNITDGVTVTGSTLSSSANSPTKISAILTVGSSPNLVNGSRLYEAQFRISSPSGPAITDRANCKLSQLSVSWS